MTSGYIESGEFYFRTLLRAHVWSVTSGRCFYCREDLFDDRIVAGAVDRADRESCRLWGLQIDHKTPISRGGSNDIENLAPACGWCNAQKNDMTRDEYHLYLYEHGIAARFLDQPDVERDWLMVPTVRPLSDWASRSAIRKAHPHFPRHNV